MKTLRNQSTCLLILLVGGFSAFSQKGGSAEDSHASLVQGKKRSMLAYSGAGRSFTMDISGKTAKPSDLPGFVSIDKQIVQATLVPVSQNIDLNYLTISREKDILTKYMDYELTYYKKKLKQDYIHLQMEWLSIHGRVFLLWYFDMPKDYKLVSRQLYLSTLFFDQIMDLNAPLFTVNDFGRARELLVKLGTSLKTSDKSLDIAALTRQLNK
jgi:hypothetical protein